MKLLVAGFPRAGTLSLKCALERLGFGPCFNFFEIVARPGAELPWLAAARGEPVDWDSALAGYVSALDWPAGAFWRELVDYFPDARTILVTRDAAAWRRSAQDAFRGLLDILDDPDLAPVAEMTRAVGDHARRTLAGADAARHPPDWPPPDDATAERVLRRYEEAVTAYVPAGRLLRYRVADGWPPLCDFLGVPGPGAPFPHLNSGEEYRSYVAEALARRAAAGDPG